MTRFTRQTGNAAHLIGQTRPARVAGATPGAGHTVAHALTLQALLTRQALLSITTSAGPIPSAVVRAQRITGNALVSALATRDHGRGIAHASLTTTRARGAVTHAIALDARVSLAARQSVSTPAIPLHVTTIRPSRWTTRTEERGWHSVPSQQPLHVAAKHSHRPRMQICPLAHAAVDPHRHIPAVEQLSAWSGLQERQVSPPVLHVRKERHSQWLLAQQPS